MTTAPLACGIDLHASHGTLEGSFRRLATDAFPEDVSHSSVCILAYCLVYMLHRYQTYRRPSFDAIALRQSTTTSTTRSSERHPISGGLAYHNHLQIRHDFLRIPAFPVFGFSLDAHRFEHSFPHSLASSMRRLPAPFIRLIRFHGYGMATQHIQRKNDVCISL